MHRSGVSSLISLVISTGIIVTSVAIALNVGGPIVDRMQETSAIQNSIDDLTRIDGKIQEVAAEGKYSSRTPSLRFQSGSYHFDNETEELYYEIETDSSFISTHSAFQQGPLLIRSNTDVSVQQDEVNGTTCYMMENDHIKACIRKVPKEFNASDHDNLVGFWRLNEGSGQWANDSSLYGNNGKLGGSTASESGDPTWTSGIHNSSLDFDGSYDYVDISGVSGFSGEPRTLAFWAASDNWTTDGNIFNSNEIPVTAGTSSGNMIFSTTSNSDPDPTRKGFPLSLSNGEWHHFAVTINPDGSISEGYLDGVKQSLDIDDGWNPNTGTLIGARDSTNPEKFFDGTIDDVRIYNRSLSEDEIEWLYLKEGDEKYVNTSRMLVQLRNKELGEDLNASLSTFINGDESTRAGTGFTEASTGSIMGRGSTTLNLTSGGTSYEVNYDLLSGSDFLLLESPSGSADTTTHELDMVIDDRTTDEKYIDGEQRGEGVYTSDSIDFGYAVGEANGTVAGLVPGGTFDTSGFYADSGNGMYTFNLTLSEETTFLPFTEGTHNVIEDREEKIQGGLFGSGNFLSFPSPSFTDKMSDDKTVRVSLSYDNIDLNGFRDTLSPGTYILTISSGGVQDGSTHVNIAVQ